MELPPIPAINPLNDSHLQAINHALQIVEVGKKQIALAEQAGLDMSNNRQELALHEKKLRSLKSVYFPGR